MFKKKRKTPGSLKALLVFAFIFLAIAAGGFVLLGIFGVNSADPNLSGPLGALQYAVSQVMDVLTFQFGGGASILYYILCGFAYLFAALGLIFIIVSIIVCASKRRRTFIPVIIISLGMVFVAYLVAVLFDKLWAIILWNPPFYSDHSLMFPA